MKKAYTKPELDMICFALNKDIVTESTEPQGALDMAGDMFEKAADGVLDLFGGLGY